MSALPAVTEVIPHRPPFLFVDEIVTCDAAGATGRRTLRADEPHYAGHYPGNPITPGVLLCEACFQVGAYYLAQKLLGEGGSALGKTPVLSRINEAKFKQMAKPGDTIDIAVKFEQTTAGFHFLNAKVTSGAKTVLTCSFVLALL